MGGAIIAAPHVFEPVTPPAWLITAGIAFAAVWLFDAIADKIPGINGVNRLPQALTLFSMASAMSSLLDTKLIGSIPDAMAKLFDNLAGAWGGLWNLGGIAIALYFAGMYARRYMGLFNYRGEGERVFPDGAMFGVILLTTGTFVPWVNEALEFWRYSVLTGTSNGAITFVASIFGFRVV